MDFSFSNFVSAACTKQELTFHVALWQIYLKTRKVLSFTVCCWFEMQVGSCTATYVPFHIALVQDWMFLAQRARSARYVEL